MQTPDLVSVAAVALLLLLLAPLASTQCPQGVPSPNKKSGPNRWFGPSNGEWILYQDSCYKLYNSPEYWHSAEMACQADNGHLVSIDSDIENRLIGRLSLCRDVWIGRYATDLSKASDPSGYSWSDGRTTNGYSRHIFNNFTERSDTQHRPLIRANSMSWYNSLYHEKHPYICEVPARPEPKVMCPPNARFFEGLCFFIPPFKTTFIEATTFCRRHSGWLLSITSDAEMRLYNSLDLSADSCSQQESVWVGLLEIRHRCVGQPSVCWNWWEIDRNYNDIPKWADSEPGTKNDDKDYCGLLRGDSLQREDCTEKHRFVCRIPGGMTPEDPVWKKLVDLWKQEGEETSKEQQQQQVNATAEEVAPTTLPPQRDSTPDSHQQLDASLNRLSAESVSNALQGILPNREELGKLSKSLEERYPSAGLDKILSE